MALASDLMGFGMPPNLAANIAVGGVGPVTITAAGTAFSSATRIQANQNFVSCSTAGGSGGAALALPLVGTDTGALLADVFVVANTTATQTLAVFASTGVLISMAGANTVSANVPVFTTTLFIPVTTTQWIGVKGS